MLPLGALVYKAASLGRPSTWHIVASERAVASYMVTAGPALGATVFNLVFGLILAWVLVRYQFPGKRLVDAVVDPPFAPPTAVAGIALTTLCRMAGSAGLLAPLGIQVAYTPLGIMIAMAFTSLPFIVRTVQPVLEDLDPALEEAAQSLGGSDSSIFLRDPAVAGPGADGGDVALLRPQPGEFGAIIFIAGNQPFETEITALLAFIRLEEYEYQAAAAIASVMLIIAFVMLAVTNLLQARALRYTARG